jgi:hypothetical protein
MISMQRKRHLDVLHGLITAKSRHRLLISPRPHELAAKPQEIEDKIDVKPATCRDAPADG